jgi:alanyl-tRNA synthetase
MTERLYYADPYCREFEATIRRVESRDGRTLVALDRTAFYPTSGGQPFDVGTLQDVARPIEGRDGGAESPAPHSVVDVIDADDGTVFHVLDSEPALARVPEAGQPVRGTIDWQRRFDHMQQHSGQHVLSAAFDRLSAARTVSFHLGGSLCTIDLDRELSRDEIARAETEANRVVWENRAVAIRFVSAEDAAALPLRKETAREGTLRLIDIDGFDLSACGGTHVASTGAIGVIAIGAVERFKGGQRVEFSCGGRALDRLRSMRDTLGGAVRLLSVLPDEVPGAIERLQGETRDRQKMLTALEHELARFRAADMAAGAETTPVGRLVLATVDGDANGLKLLASAIVSRPGHLAILASTSRPALVVAARSQDVAIAANQLIAALIASFGGRGGGRPDLAQAGGLDAPAESILERARTLVGSRTGQT